MGACAKRESKQVNRRKRGSLFFYSFLLSGAGTSDNLGASDEMLYTSTREWKVIREVVILSLISLMLLQPCLYKYTLLVDHFASKE